MILILTGFNIEAKPLVEIAPVTSKNIKGHIALYDEGWLVVTSSRKALDYAYEHGIRSSADAWGGMTMVGDCLVAFILRCIGI